METKKIRIETEYIKLGALLKFAGMVADGSEAKALIAMGKVTYNGEIETRRGKKVRSGDAVTMGDRTVEII
jgi:ribosome-associated protein